MLKRGIPHVRALPYAQQHRLGDVLALMQVLALDEHAHRSEEGLDAELLGSPRTAESWVSIASEHPEFFRVRSKGSRDVSLVARHVQPRVDGKRVPIPLELLRELISVAVTLHDRQLAHHRRWHAFLPIFGVFIAGLFTLLGAALKALFP